MFWVDRQSDRIVVGAKRLATVLDDEDRKRYAYVFYGDTFFDASNDPKWEGGMGHEMIAFTHYYIVENGGIFLPICGGTGSYRGRTGAARTS
nr:hypothetical protein [Veillonella denticariosi]